MAIEQPPKNPEERDYDRSAALWSLPELQDVLARITDTIFIGTRGNILPQRIYAQNICGKL